MQIWVSFGKDNQHRSHGLKKNLFLVNYLKSNIIKPCLRKVKEKQYEWFIFLSMKIFGQFRKSLFIKIHKMQCF